MRWEHLVDAAVVQRHRRAGDGQDAAVRLRLGGLEPGAVGVVEAHVAALGAARPFTRRNGTPGQVCRVTLRDASGEADLVLWDADVRAAAELAPGQAVRIRGAVVKAGRGDPELALGGVAIEPLGASAPVAQLAGTLVAVSPTRAVGEPVRFQTEAEVATAAGLATVVAEGEAVKAVRALSAGTRLSWPVRQHPFLEGWHLAAGLPAVADGGAARQG